MRGSVTQYLSHLHIALICATAAAAPYAVEESKQIRVCKTHMTRYQNRVDLCNH